jgi:hypothetical protein
MVFNISAPRFIFFRETERMVPMHRFMFAFLVLIALSPNGYAAASGYWIDVDQTGIGEPVVELIQSSASGCLMDIYVPKMWVETEFASGQIFQKVSLPGAGTSGMTGEPGLPLYARWLAIPSGSSVSARVVEADYVEFSGYNLYPVQRPLPDIENAFQEFTINLGAYTANRYLPEQAVTVGNPCILRDMRMAQVSAYPIQFNPYQGKIRVASRMRISLDFTGSSNINNVYRRDSGTQAFRSLQKSMVLNYDPDVPTAPGSYLIITADAFASAIGPLAAWKHQKGYPTVLTKLSEIAPGDSASIHKYIKEAYDTWEFPPEYVLLVGDVEFMPTGMHQGIYPPPWGEYYYFGTDHCYSLLAGDDIFSDVFIGRLPVNSAEECSTVVAKLLDYETTPDTTKQDWFKQASTVGVQQNGRIFQNTCRKVKSIMLSAGYAQVDTLFEGPTPPGFATPTDICDSLNDGRSFLMYRGHGAQDGWWTDQSYNILATTHVDSLKNGRNFTVAIVPTCLANAFFDEGQKCMGEAFLLQSQGAAGYFGATDVSYSFWNDSLAIGIFRGIFEEGAYHFQQACDYGKLFMEKYYPLSDPDTAEITAQQFFFMNIVGDPELPLWTDIPRPLAVTHEDTVGTGFQFIDVYVTSQSLPVANALVCMMKGSETYEADYTDASGFLTLGVSPKSQGTMDVTVTARNCLPYVGQIAVVGAPVPPALISPLDRSVLADTMPAFVWFASAGDSGSYEITLARDSSFSVDPVTLDSLTDTTCFFPQGLADGTYFWAVQAFDWIGQGSGYQPHAFSFTVDCMPPEFSNTTIMSDTSFAGPFDIYTMIEDSTGVSACTLYYRVNPDSEWVGLAMDSTGSPDSFYAQIPAQSGDDTIGYFLVGYDNSFPANWSTDPCGAPSTFYSFEVIQTGTEEVNLARLPLTFGLNAAWPNPSRHLTAISYQTPRKCTVRIAVYDASGRMVKNVVDDVLPAGYHSAAWDGTDSEGKGIVSGVYFYLMQADEFFASKKVLVLK